MDIEVIASYLSGNATEAQRLAVDKWRSEPGNENRFSSYREAWELAAADKERILPDTEMAWKNLSNAIDESADKHSLKLFHWLAAAAVIVIPVLLYSLLFTKSPALPAKQTSSIAASPVLLAEVYTTDSLVQFYLPDSSRVLLNKNSRLFFPEKFSGKQRRVKLTGEAFFEIEKDPSKPFVIEAGHSLTKVTGTSFNLNAKDKNNVELSVVTGTVEFSALNDPGAHKLVVFENNRAVLKGNELTAVKFNAEEKEWWRERKQNRFKRFLGKIKKIFTKEN